MSKANCMGSIWPSSRKPTFLIRMADTLLDWLDRKKERDALSRLDERMLKDIGITKGEVMAETQKPFWRR